MPQLYYSPISINSAQVPSTQTDFPVLVSQTDNRFKTTGNGGHVANANGYDIRPYSDSSLTTALTGYELERYNASTGEVIMWVKVSSLTSSSTPIYLGYGDTGITSDGSSATTWSNNFIDVFHLANGTTLNVNSATGTHNGTNHGVTATSGQIDGGGAFVAASTQYVDLGAINPPSAVTLSAWVNVTSFAATQWVLGGQNASPNRYNVLLLNTSGKLSCNILANADVSYNGGSHTLSTATWYYIAMTYDSSAGLIGYVNAASDGTAAANGPIQQATSQPTQLGYNLAFTSQAYGGSMDEARFSGIARSADWITTEYNNQNAPGTFETLGAEVAVSPISGLFRL